MDPNKFRESRLKINHLCKEINTLIDQKSVDVPKAKASFQEVSSCLDKLTPKAEGEIQERSVKNLSIKVEALSPQIDKLKEGVSKRGPKEPVVLIEWNEELVANLSSAFLKKILANIGENPKASVCFSATGKGVRPSYKVIFDDKTAKSFSGSSHNPLKRPLPTEADKISKPFPYEMISSIVKN